uniref:Oncoprotein-induced transcript 3 protein-like n=1 Tax=Crassostrea virginica TaxID=6565 RepID=A0A8B8CPJ8_CRAVI|nr:oncoprotein-induced transcript 3 protein-like [Crassostrea virginica]
MMNVLYWMVFFQTATLSGAAYYCDVGDPCAEANIRALYQPYARSVNCKQDILHGACDRHITPQWYRVDVPMLRQCPELQSCGALYPVWLNGTLPNIRDGTVDRTACTAGFGSCCVRSYGIQIKHCGQFYAFCLAALDTCPERYCFGENGPCDYPASITPVKRTSFSKDRTKDQPDTLEIIFILILIVLTGIFVSLLCFAAKKYNSRPVDIGVLSSMVNRIVVEQDACEQKKPPSYTSR